MALHHNFEIFEGSRRIELKSSGGNKEAAAQKILDTQKSDFILGSGDEWSDEFLFSHSPSHAWTVCVGMGSTFAQYRIENPATVRTMLSQCISPTD